jgi:hypothetical protein
VIQQIKIDSIPPTTVENQVEEDPLHNVESLNVDIKTGRVSMLEQEEPSAVEPLAQSKEESILEDI